MISAAEVVELYNARVRDEGSAKQVMRELSLIHI